MREAANSVYHWWFAMLSTLYVFVKAIIGVSLCALALNFVCSLNGCPFDTIKNFVWILQHFWTKPIGTLLSLQKSLIKWIHSEIPHNIFIIVLTLFFWCEFNSMLLMKMDQWCNCICSWTIGINQILKTAWDNNRSLARISGWVNAFSLNHSATWFKYVYILIWHRKPLGNKSSYKWCYHIVHYATAYIRIISSIIN